jgi:hypothetical protein
VGFLSENVVRISHGVRKLSSYILDMSVGHGRNRSISDTMA